VAAAVDATGRAGPDEGTVRPLCVRDAADVARIFYAAVTEGAARDYSEAERRAWAGDAPDPRYWTERLARLSGMVAALDGRVAGFIATDGSGHVDLVFVDPGFAGRGIGRALLRAVEAEALARGVTRLTTDASRTARPFFERQGFEALREQRVERRGVVLVNHRMEKTLAVRPSSVSGTEEGRGAGC
jgi:putative acetyltransferase